MRKFLVAFGPMILKTVGIIMMVGSLFFLNNMPVCIAVLLFGAWLLFIGILALSGDKYDKIVYLFKQKEYDGALTMLFLKTLTLVTCPLAALLCVWPNAVVFLLLQISIVFSLLFFCVFICIVLINWVRSMYRDAKDKFRKQ